MSATSSVSTKFTAIDNYTAKVKRMEVATTTFANKARTGLARANRGFRRLTSPIRAVGRQLGELGIILGATAIIGVVGNAINTFKDFEQANANLASVLGKTSSQTKALQNNAKQLGATTAFTASQVTSLQTEFAKLGFSQTEILNSTEATLALAAATKTELPQAAKQVGAAVRAFGLDASESARIADVFAASTSKSALNMEFLDTAMSKVAPVAKQFGFSVEDSTALLGKLADAGFDASTAATSTRSILLNLADGNGKLAKALGKPVKTLPELTKGLTELRERGVDLNSMLGLTDKRSVAAFATFLEGAEGVDKLGKALEGAGGTAQKMAEQQLDTLDGSLTKLGSAYEGFILSMEDGTGTFAKTLRLIVDTATEMLSLASGTAESEGNLSKYERVIRKYARTARTFLKVVGYTTAAVLTFKGAIILGRAALLAYNVVTGISAGVQGVLTRRVATSTAALNAYRVALALSHPVGLLSMAVVGLGAAYMASNKQMTKANIAAKVNDDLQERVISKTANQRAEIQRLFKTLRTAVVHSGEYNKALARVEQLQPGITEQYSLQVGLIKDLNKAQKDLIKTIEKKAEIEARAELYNESVRDRLQLEEKVRQKRGQSPFSQFVQGFYDYDNTLDRLQERLMEAKMREGALLEGVSADERSQLTNPRATQNETFSNFIQRSITTNTLKIKDETGRAEMENENSDIPIMLTSTGGS